MAGTLGVLGLRSKLDDDDDDDDDDDSIVVDDARSELKPSCRKRAVGGGWERS